MLLESRRGCDVDEENLQESRKFANESRSELREASGVVVSALYDVEDECFASEAPVTVLLFVAKESDEVNV